jgi:hypothetical protein
MIEAQVIRDVCEHLTWRTIRLGLLANTNEYCKAMESANIQVGHCAMGILHGPAFASAAKETDVDLVVLSGGQLGFEEAAAAAAALLTYFRSEASAAIKWLFDPVARRLPWNQTVARSSHGTAPKLSSKSTFADLFLITPDGKNAKYEKTGDYVVDAQPLSSYHEAVTSSGAPSGFSTELGVIVETTTEHGFLVSRIDLGSVLGVGTRFRNVYRVHFQDCFIAEEEHWTQEIALPTKHLTLRIHFPLERPPKLVRSKRLVGLTQERITNGAAITELFGEPAIVWEIQKPKLGEIHKLEWRW